MEIIHDIRILCYDDNNKFLIRKVIYEDEVIFEDKTRYNLISSGILDDPITAMSAFVDGHSFRKEAQPTCMRWYNFIGKYKKFRV